MTTALRDRGRNAINLLKMFISYRYRKILLQERGRKKWPFEERKNRSKLVRRKKNSSKSASQSAHLRIRLEKSTNAFHHFMCASCQMFIALRMYLSALHGHNYRLPKLIISSRLMCWRLFVMCFFSSFLSFIFCGQRVLWSCAFGNTREMPYRLKKKNSKPKPMRKWNKRNGALKNEWIFENWHTKCTHSLTHSFVALAQPVDDEKDIPRKSNRIRTRSINSQINSRSQCSCSAIARELFRLNSMQ